ncbi:MAG TPA: response regulator, partial [Planctomycetota bacterium]|nr:response regulator [Planctomycetota bacterium]
DDADVDVAVAARTGAPTLASARDAGAATLHRALVERGLSSGAAFPTPPLDGAVRVLAAYVRAERRFDADELAFLRDAAEALHATRRRKSDARARRALERRVREGEKAESLARFARGAAHELNNHLMGILGHAELAAASRVLDAEARRRCDAVVELARAAGGLGGRLADLAGRARPGSTAVDVNAVASAAANRIASALLEDRALEYRLAPTAPSVRGDAAALTRAAAELLANALEATPPGGRATCSTGVDDFDAADLAEAYPPNVAVAGRYAWIEAVDEGPGVTRAVRRRMFDPYFTTHAKGRGWGLPLASGIARSHGGALLVGGPEGGGARFRLLIPVAASRASAPERTAPAPKPPSTARVGPILVVDDQDAVRRIARAMLERLGFDVVEANGGRRALEVYREACVPPAVVLMDVSMPGGDGPEAAVALHAIDPELPVLLMSGEADQAAASTAAPPAVAGFLRKPFDSRSLARILRRLGIDPPGDRRRSAT